MIANARAQTRMELEILGIDLPFDSVAGWRLGNCQKNVSST
jgi:hypothetical protein